MWLCSLGPHHCSGDKGLTPRIFFFLQFSTHDVQFCSPNASICYTEVLQETSDCDVSCTGLYADVVFTEDTILNTRAPFSVINSQGRKTGLKIQNDKPDQDKARQNLLRLLEKYSEYKTSFVRQIKFDPQLSNHSEFSPPPQCSVNQIKWSCLVCCNGVLSRGLRPYIGLRTYFCLSRL